MDAQVISFRASLNCFVLAVSLGLSACVSTPGGRPPYLQQLEAMHIAPATLQRIEAGRVLTFQDVLELVKKGVPGDKIVAYLRSTRAPYNYSQAQVNALTDAGADSVLINYVGRSIGDFMIDAQNAQQQQQLRQDAKWKKSAWRDPYFNDPAYWGVAPFPYMFPGEWY